MKKKHTPGKRKKKYNINKELYKLPPQIMQQYIMLYKKEGEELFVKNLIDKELMLGKKLHDAAKNAHMVKNQIKSRLYRARKK